MIYVSIDLDTEKLRIYYEKSPSNAYQEIKKYLTNNGFNHFKDTNYVSDTMDELNTIDLMEVFSEANKWFPLCQNKVDILEVVNQWNHSKTIDNLIDENYKLKMEQKHLKKKKDNNVKER